MKHIAIVVALLATSAISFMAGRESVEPTVISSMSSEDSLQWKKDFQVACKLSDVYRNVIDNIDEFYPEVVSEIEEIYYEHVVNLDCDTTLVITKEDIESTRYYWIY